MLTELEIEEETILDLTWEKSILLSKRNSVINLIIADKLSQ